MKRLTSALIAISLVAAVPATVGAQTSTAPGATDRPATGRGTPERRANDRASKPERQTWSNPQLHETGDIIGTAVQGPDGKNVGKVEALLIEPRDGKVSHAVIGMGGMLGIGEEKVVVPYSALNMSGHDNGRKATIRIDQATLDKAPKYAKAGDRDRGVASPATTPRSGTTSGSGTTTGSGGFSGDPRSDKARDADGRPTSERPATERK
jgi:sporulation protein YlmC with PRC-barrel domain